MLLETNNRRQEPSELGFSALRGDYAVMLGRIRQSKPAASATPDNMKNDIFYLV